MSREVVPGWEDPHDMVVALYASAMAGNVGPALDRWRDRMDPGLVAWAEHGRRYSAADYVRMRGRRLALYDAVRALFERYDLLLTPTLSVAAFGTGLYNPEHWPQEVLEMFRWAGFGYPFNLTWLPAASCPCGFSSEGLPVGLQIVAGRFQDRRVLQASRAFEKLHPWDPARPPTAA